MRKIGLQLVRETQQAVLEEKAFGGGTALEKGEDEDLLSLLIKVDMNKDILPEQQLSVGQIPNQIPTFLIAFHKLCSSTRSLYSPSNPLPLILVKATTRPPPPPPQGRHSRPKPSRARTRGVPARRAVDGRSQFLMLLRRRCP